jgi:N-acetylglucosamine-6-phosphate deacetylase
MYGTANITPSQDPTLASESVNGNIPVKMITVAPEQGAMTSLIPELTARGITVSIGHSEATYEEASAAVSAGATMITHLFNAMRPLHHRNPGIFGVLGVAEPHAITTFQPPQEQEREGRVSPAMTRPYFGLICDGIHLHPATVKIAWHAHPAGLILVTDAMHMVGLPDGRYPWTNGEGEHFIVKKGGVLELEETGAIAGR